MNRLGVVLVFAALILVPVGLQGQDQAAASHHAAHKPQGFADYALGKINPNDTDYGEALDTARGATVTHTMDDLYFWSNVVALILLSGVTTAFLFHLRAADKKEITAATLIAQRRTCAPPAGWTSISKSRSRWSSNAPASASRTV